MNENKICFIYCVNNELSYQESVRYLQSLHVPEGVTIEYLAVWEAESMAAGYNHAMQQSDAKYKVYLHQDVFIINRYFIADVIQIFKSNSHLGLMGVVGASDLPTNAVWWESANKFGEVYESHTGKMSLLKFHDVPGRDYVSVKGIDGLIMITQYDIPWREDIFTGWHFYDISQSMEFINNGYDVGVPHQKEPWCIHDCGVVNTKNGYEEYRKLFMREYGGKDDFPLVSVLIPAYNRPEYLELAVQSVLNQTYRNIEIVICDDSTDDRVKQMLTPYLLKHDNIRYYKNEVNLNTGNFSQCFKLAKGKYVNYLMDDDLFHEEKVERMVHYFETHTNVRLVTSHRHMINGEGELLSSGKTKLFEEDQVINGIIFGNHMLETGMNLVGEPTTAMFRKEDIKGKIGRYYDHDFTILNDLAVWLHLMVQGDIVYISEGLSYFRQHEGQNQRNPKYVLNSIKDWIQIVYLSRNDGYLESDNHYQKAMSTAIKQAMGVIDFYQSINMVSILKENDIMSQLTFALNEILN